MPPAKINNVIVISGLRGSETTNSALENYAAGFCSAFLDRGMKVSPIDITAMNRMQQLIGLKPPTGMKFAMRLGRFSIIYEYFYALLKGVSLIFKRDETALFVVNTSIWYLLIVYFYRIIGFNVIYWIVDYYPNQKRKIHSAISSSSDLTIVINKYIQQTIPKNAPVLIFQGGTHQRPPTRIASFQDKSPVRLLYAGRLNHLNSIDEILDLVAQRPDELSLTLFGEGEYSELAYEFARGYPNIDMRGLQPHSVVQEFMKNVDGVLSIRRLDDDYYKGFFPSKLIEMIASPAQVFVSRMDEVTDDLEGAVIFVEGSGAANFIDALDKARSLTKSDAERQLRQRQELLGSVFNWDRLAEIVEQSRCLK